MNRKLFTLQGQRQRGGRAAAPERVPQQASAPPEPQPASAPPSDRLARETAPQPASAPPSDQLARGTAPQPASAPPSRSRGRRKEQAASADSPTAPRTSHTQAAPEPSPAPKSSPPAPAPDPAPSTAEASAGTPETWSLADFARQKGMPEKLLRLLMLAHMGPQAKTRGRGFMIPNSEVTDWTPPAVVPVSLAADYLGISSAQLYNKLNGPWGDLKARLNQGGEGRGKVRLGVPLDLLPDLQARHEGRTTLPEDREESALPAGSPSLPMSPLPDSAFPLATMQLAGEQVPGGIRVWVGFTLDREELTRLLGDLLK
jgi:hypothetical protein